MVAGKRISPSCTPTFESERAEFKALIRPSSEGWSRYTARMFERWTRGVVRWRFLVLGLWALVTIFGIVTATRLPDLLSTSLDVPGSNSALANRILAHDFHENIEGSFGVVVPLRGETSNQNRDELTRVRRAVRVIPGAEITQHRMVDATLYVNVDTPQSLSSAANETDTLDRALRNEGVVGALVSGPPALQHDISPVLSSDLVRGEIVTVGVALIVLLVFLGLSWEVALPFLVAIATTALALLALYALARHITMVIYVPNIVELLGLGLAMDYSLLMVHRFRRQLRTEGASVEDAVVATLNTAGRTVVLSGLAVALALIALMFVSVPFVRSLAIGALLVPVAGIIGALTLQPALLSIRGPGARRRNVTGLYGRREALNGWWARIAQFALRRPKSVLTGSLVVLLLLGSSLWWLQLTPASLTAIPATMSSAKALRLASSQVGPGFLTPIEIVIDTGRVHGADAPALSAARTRMALTLLHHGGVEFVAIGEKAPYLSASGRYERVFVVTRDQFGAAEDQTLVRQLRSSIIPRADFPSTAKVFVGGAAAQGVDFLTVVYANIGWLIAFVIVMTYLVLLRAFRSLVLPLLAVLLGLLSMAGTYGVMVAVFRFGVGSTWLGTYHVSQIEGWVPILIFAVLFGLSMDYEVFIVSRIREGKDRGLATNDAVVYGIGNTGGVVGAAALIMIGAMSGFVVGHVAGLQELGVGLGAGIIIDVTIVRALVLPSVMGLLGRWNWWLPEPFAKFLQSRPHPSGSEK